MRALTYHGSQDIRVDNVSDAVLHAQNLTAAVKLRDINLMSAMCCPVSVGIEMEGSHRHDIAMTREEWFARYLKRLGVLCPKDVTDDLVLRVWAKWGVLSSVRTQIRHYPDTPELAADDLYQWELERADMRGEFNLSK